VDEAAGELAVHGGHGRQGCDPVGQRAQKRGEAAAEGSVAALPLGRSNGLAVAAIGRDELEQFWRLGQHRPGSFPEALRLRLRAFDESKAIRRLSNDAVLGKQFPENGGIMPMTVRWL
jgi:hypothetical protein